MRDSIVIMGGGLMGSGIAAVSALAGNPTIIVDVDRDKAKGGVMDALKCVRELCSNGLASDRSAEQAEGLLEPEADMGAALEKANMVIEAVSENLELKQTVFKQLDELLPREIPITSNTSGLRISDIARYTKYPERTVSTHFWFPGHLIPLVEVVVGEHTDIQVAKQVKERLETWGKSPVLVKKDLPGQLANRIYQAIIREAIQIVSMGLADAEDVDTAIKVGMGLRFPIMGPLEHMDTIGLELTASVQDTVLPEISAARSASTYLAGLIESGRRGYKDGQGFYDWSGKDMEEITEKRNRYLMKAIQLLKTSNETL